LDLTTEYAEFARALATATFKARGQGYA